MTPARCWGCRYGNPCGKCPPKDPAVHNCMRHGPSPAYVFTRKTGKRAGKVETQCATCHRDGRPRTALQALWDDNHHEYRYLRETLGMTPEQIGEKHGVRWKSFQRTLWRRLGGMAKW